MHGITGRALAGRDLVGTGIVGSGIEHAEPRVVALAHPSLDRLVARFAAQLVRDDLGDGTIDHRVSMSSSERMTPRTLRLGLIKGHHLISIASVEPDGSAAMATLAEWRGSGIDRQLLAMIVERSLTVGGAVPVFCDELLDPNLVTLAVSCGAEVIGRTPVRWLEAV